MARLRVLAGLCCIVVLLFVGVATAQTAKSGLSNYSLGVEAYRQGEFRRAFDAWSLGAYEGDAEAQYNLGVLYLEGRGVERNSEQARDWFLLAARKQHLEAQYNLGHMALSGMGMEKDTDKALNWWRQSAEGGYAQAQFNYGRALYLGVGDVQDKKAGLALVQAASAQQDKRAQLFLQQNAANTEDQPGELKLVTLEAKVDVAKVDVAKVDEEARGGVEVDQSESVEKEANTLSPEIVKTGQSLAEVSEYEPGKVKLNIVRDEPQVRKNYYLRTLDQPVDVYALPDLSNQLDTLAPKSLVKVLSMDVDQLRIEVVTQLFVWSKSSGLEQSDDAASAALGGLVMYSQPGGAPLGELPQNLKLQILDHQGEWLKLSVPQHIYGWIAARSLAYSGESSEQLQAQWFRQLRMLDGWQKPPLVQAESNDAVQAESNVAVQAESKDEQLAETVSQLQMNQQHKVSQANTVKEKPKPNSVEKSSISSIKTNTKAGVSLNDNTWLFTQAEGAYVVHLFTLLDHAKALQIANKTILHGKAQLYTTQAQQQSWSFLLLGPYADVETAKIARSRLPGYLAKGARVRSIALIVENRCKKRLLLDKHESEGLDAFCLE